MVKPYINYKKYYDRKEKYVYKVNIFKILENNLVKLVKENYFITVMYRIIFFFVV